MKKIYHVIDKHTGEPLASYLTMKELLITDVLATLNSLELHQESRQLKHEVLRVVLETQGQNDGNLIKAYNKIQEIFYNANDVDNDFKVYTEVIK